MLQCVDSFRNFFEVLLKCFHIDLHNNSKGLNDPEFLASETPCMFNFTFEIIW